MHIELRPLDSITPYDQNPRVNDGAVDAVAASLREFGFRQPIVVDAEGVIVVGHTRWKAAKKLGLEKVPVHVAKELTPAQAKAYRIADNQTATIAEWDFDLLPVELKELEALNFDLGLLGFEAGELAEIMAPAGNPGLTDPDDVPEPPDAAETQPGDLWVLGEHRLLCGSSAEAGDVDRLLGGARIHLVNTDPPYNVAVEPRSNNAIAAGHGTFTSGQKMHLGAFDAARAAKKTGGAVKGTHAKLRAKDRQLKNDAVTPEAFDAMLLAWFGNAARALEPGRAFYIWGGYANWKNYPAPLEACGLYFAQGIIWVKHHPVLGRKDFMNDWECCFYGWKEGAAHQFYGPRNVSNTWEVKKLHSSKMVHLTEKPVELAARALAYSSKPGENCLDLFGGSGSTLIACEQQGRRAFLMELDPLYCDVIRARWESFSGKKAVLMRGDSVAERKAPAAAEAQKQEAA